MRNLKKILALVLALVMSLSLMATASATDFTDESSIKDEYKTAVSVLSQLEVFKGYSADNTFRPQGDITRAEVATIIYRIATGDAKDAQKDIYTNMTTSFTDLNLAEWARGYVNYCHNAQIIKGESATKFNPNGKITGYATLAMILRAMGYGKNGEFEGKGWEYQTAAIAKQIGLIDNVIEAQLGAPAPRELVAEILFRALLTSMVDYTPLNGYVENNKTLGYEKFGLEDVSGVVTANEWANLDDNKAVLPVGKTELTSADKTRTLDITTPITDIGETFDAYVARSKVLAMENSTGTVWQPENGKGVDISTTAKFEKETGLKRNSDTKDYHNFNLALQTYSDWVIRYRVVAASVTSPSTLAYLTANASLSDGVYTRQFTPGTTIPDGDIEIMRTIFYTADRVEEGFLRGEVYAGTSSMKDLSDSKAEGGISWNEFVDTYLIDRNAYNIDGSGNGDWLKVIDNDGDGYADYVFLTKYTLDEAVSTYKNKAGDTVMQYYDFDDDDTSSEGKYPTIYMDGVDRIERDVEVGTVVLYAVIDKQILVSKAADVTKTVEKYVFKTDEITTTDGNTYGQSTIDNATQMQQDLTAMDEKVEYVMYFDKFGYVRAYELAGGTKYALVTEVYYKNNQNGNLQQNWPMTVELTMPNDAGEAVTKEYNLANVTAATNPFIARSYWYGVSNPVFLAPYENWLQPAIAHLGTTGVVRDDISFALSGSSFSVGLWTLNQQLVRNYLGTDPSPLNDSTEFNYGTTVAPEVSYTNVAVVSFDGDNATLKGAAQHELTLNGNPTGRYDVDYIQLSTDDIAEKSVRYAIGGPNAADDNYYVNAVHDTEFYIAYNGGVYYVKDYDKFPGLTNEKNNIHAAYAVARDTSADNAAAPYWVADVIVYEVEKWNDDAKSSISLVYYDYSRTTGETWMLNTLNNKADGIVADVVPENVTWWTYTGYGFYDLYNTKANDDGTMTARRVTPITKNFNDNGIYAGTVTREVYIANGGAYIDVNLYNKNADGTTHVDGDGRTLATDASIKLTNNIYSIINDKLATSDNRYNEANALQYSATSWSQVKANDRVIWVGAAKGTGVSSASFIVDLSHGENPNLPASWNYDNSIYYNTAAFLGWHGPVNQGVNLGNWNPAPVNPASVTTRANLTDAQNGVLWRAIWDEQQIVTPTTGYKITVKTVGPTGDTNFKAITRTPTDISVGDTYTLLTANYKIPGYQVRAITTDPTSAGGPPTYTTDKGTTFTPTGTTQIVIGNLQENVTVELEYEVATPTLTLDNTGYTNAGVVNDLPTAGFGGGATPAQYTYGDTWTVTVPVSAGNGYTAVVKDSTGATVTGITRKVLTDGKTQFSGTITDNLTIKITEYSVNITAAINEDGVATPLTTAGIKYKVGENGGEQTLTAGANALKGVVPGDKVTFTSTVDFFAKKGDVSTTLADPDKTWQYTVPGDITDPASPVTASIDFYQVLTVKVYSNVIDSNTQVQVGSTLSPKQVILSGVMTDAQAVEAKVPYGADLTADLVDIRNIASNLELVVAWNGGTQWPTGGQSGTYYNLTDDNVLFYFTTKTPVAP